MESCSGFSNERQARQLVADSGRMLITEGLVARTWGNVSCRTGADRFVITPSGLGYAHMTADDIVPLSMKDGTWSGARKPSSEKGIHTAAYTQFSDAGFVIHTHQTYASALGLTEPGTLELSEPDRAALGGVAFASYGLPGSKRLSANVAAALATGAHTILMAHHGVLVVGRDLDEAFARAKLLESLCEASCKGQPKSVDSEEQEPTELVALAEAVAAAVGSAAYTADPAVVEASLLENGVPAQLDDMAQMVGRKLIAVPAEPGAVIAALKAHDAVLVRGLGAICCEKTKSDRAALLLLVQKASVCILHTRACGVSAGLTVLDTALMRAVYQLKYAKKIGG